MNIQNHHLRYKQNKSLVRILLLILITSSITTFSVSKATINDSAEEEAFSSNDYAISGAIDLYHDEDHLYVLESNTIDIYQMNNPYAPTLLAKSNESNTKFL